MKTFCAITWGYVLETGQFVPVRCDQWSCDYCRKIKSLRLAQRAVLGVRDMSGVPMFWTLTMPGHINSVSFAYKVLPKNWDTFRKRVQRQAPNFYYFAVVEGQPRRGGMPHFHILSDASLSSKQTLSAERRALKDYAVASGFGYQCSLENVNDAKILNYVSKYVSKSDRAMPKAFRRVRVSRDWPEVPEYTPAGTLISWDFHATLKQWINYLCQASGVYPDDLLETFGQTVDRLSKGHETSGNRLE